MYISRLMVHAQQVEESRLKKKNREAKRATPKEQSQPRSKKRFYNQESPMVNNDRVSNPNSQGGNGSGFYFERPICDKYGKQHLAKGREAKQASLEGLDSNAPRKNRFYVLQENKDKGANPDEGTDAGTKGELNGCSPTWLACRPLAPLRRPMTNHLSELIGTKGEPRVHFGSTILTSILVARFIVDQEDKFWKMVKAKGKQVISSHMESNRESFPPPSKRVWVPVVDGLYWAVY
uniref:Gag-pol polyprotein n=1 Tax=Solanum tuberosum TaxID=4113 RepID=M1DNN9_SOLTU